MSKADGEKRPKPKSTWVQSTWLLLFMVIIYVMVLATTHSVHKKHKRYSQDHPYKHAGLRPRKKEATKDHNDSELHRIPVMHDLIDGQQEVTNILQSDNQLDLTVGQQVTDILQNKIPFDEQHQRLRFLPGTLSLTEAETLSHCYADPDIYEHHFTKRKKRGIPISLKNKLVFVMIAKSGSSTGRWVMNNILEAEELRVHKDLLDLSSGGKYEDFSAIAFVRDPLSRFYSSYDEVFYRYGPWMEVTSRRHGFDSWAKHVREFDHPHAYLYENMTSYQDFQDAFCPPKFIPKGYRELRVASPRIPNWCTDQPTRENGTLAATFERFVWEYDGVTPWDVHLNLQVPMLCNQKTGRPARINEVFRTETSTENWKSIVARYGQLLPESEFLNGRAIPRRFNPKFVSIETKQRICQIAAIDYCCLNLKLPMECDDEGVDVSCALDKDEGGDYRIQPWSHPNEVSRERSELISGNKR
jgi:hypothetical protein